MHNDENLYTTCLLESGKIVPYDAAGTSESAYDPNVFYFIGCGFIYSIGGVIQKKDKKLYFFNKK